MVKILLLTILIILITFIVFFAINLFGGGEPAKNLTEESVGALPQNNPPANNNQNVPSSGFEPPLSRSEERVVKKNFGIYITPKNSPVQPERFIGYHTGADFEIFSEELNKEVLVRAICSGKLLMKKWVAGYGGVVVQECKLFNEPVTIIYGHLKLAGINYNIQENINVGSAIGVLGMAFSAETDGERKHLHLGVHKGAEINIRGYVQNKNELSGWADPCLYSCNN